MMKTMNIYKKGMIKIDVRSFPKDDWYFVKYMMKNTKTWVTVSI